MAENSRNEDPEKTCFVISPIGDEGTETRNRADWFLRIVETGLDGRHYRIERADKMTRPGLITEQIINAVSDADLVIADLTGQNPNVFYELAIRHREEKPVIHMILAGERPPFDVYDFRLVYYSIENPGLVDKAASELRDHIQETEKPSYKVSNPITAARGTRKLAESSDSMEQLVLGMRRQMDEMSVRLGAVELGSIPPRADESIFQGALVKSLLARKVPVPGEPPPSIHTILTGEPDVASTEDEPGPRRKK